jgi:GAF domain-containing protein
VELLKARGSFIRVLDPSRTRLEPGAWHGVSEEDVSAMPEVVDDNTVDASALARQELIEVRDARQDPRWKHLPLAEQNGPISVMAAPLCVSERCVGTLHVYFESPHEFDDAERSLVRSVCAQAAAVLWRLLLQRQAEAVAEISREISSSLEEETVLDSITRQAAEVLSFKAASIRLLDEEGERLVQRSAHGLSERYPGKGPVEPGRSPADRAVLQGETVEVAEEEFDEKLAHPDAIRQQGIRALLCLPLKVKDRPVGVLRVYAAAPHSFDESERRFLQTLANHGAVAIENARLFEHVRRDYQDLKRAVWRWYDWGERPPRM